MANQICPVHGEEFRFIPAGISKRTGKAYHGFWACPEVGCKEKPKAQDGEGASFTPEPESPSTGIVEASLTHEEVEEIVESRLQVFGKWLLGQLDKKLITLMEATPSERLSDKELEEIDKKIGDKDAD